MGKEIRVEKKVITILSYIYAIINIIFFALFNYMDGEKVYIYLVMVLLGIDIGILGGYICWNVYIVYSRWDYYGMRSYYSKLDIKHCRDYLSIININDLRYKVIEVAPNRYRFLFEPQTVKGYIYRTQFLGGVEYQVNLYELDNGTEITWLFKENKRFKIPICPWYIDRFMERRCNAAVKALNYEKEF